jgi:flagellar assembly protein FliH
MSSDAWRPRTVVARASTAGPRIARILTAGEELDGAKPVEWRQVGGHAGAWTGGAAAGTKEPTPDMTAQMAHLQQQCELRVREAHAAGTREAEAAARTRAASEVQQVLEKMAHTIGELAQMRGRLRKQAEGDTVKLSLAIARRIVRREVAMDPEALRGLVIAALETLQAKEVCRVRANVSQAAAMAAILRQTATHGNVEVVPDGSLAPGGIIFETTQGNLDASVDSQLQEIERGLADHMRKQS